MAVTLEQAQIYIKAEDPADEQEVSICLSAAQSWVSKFIEKPLADVEGDTADLDCAVLLLVGEFYKNREAETATPALSPAIRALCDFYRPMGV